MTNTYPKDANMETKIYEELRCTRCVLERILRVMDEGLFTDYEMEKFNSWNKEKFRKEYKHAQPNELVMLNGRKNMYPMPKS